MQKIRTHFQTILEYGPIPGTVVDALLDELQKSCVEYAKYVTDHIVDIESNIDGKSVNQLARHVLGTVKGYYTEIINQDSLDLPTN